MDSSTLLHQYHLAAAGEYHSFRDKHANRHFTYKWLLYYISCDENILLICVIVQYRADIDTRSVPLMLGNRDKLDRLAIRKIDNKEIKGTNLSIDQSISK